MFKYLQGTRNVSTRNDYRTSGMSSKWPSLGFPRSHPGPLKMTDSLSLMVSYCWTRLNISRYECPYKTHCKHNFTALKSQPGVSLVCHSCVTGVNCCYLSLCSPNTIGVGPIIRQSVCLFVCFEVATFEGVLWINLHKFANNLHKYAYFYNLN